MHQGSLLCCGSFLLARSYSRVPSDSHGSLITLSPVSTPRPRNGSVSWHLQKIGNGPPWALGALERAGSGILGSYCHPISAVRRGRFFLLGITSSKQDSVLSPKACDLS